MQMSNTILLCSANAVYLESIAIILEFIGETVIKTQSIEQLNKSLLSQELPHRSVIIDRQLANFSETIINFSQQPFLILGDDADALVNKHANVIGSLPVALKYEVLTQQIHHCQDFFNKRPKSINRSCSSSSMLFRSLVGRSQPIQQVRQLIEQVASTDANVLVLGESGTGKEVIARNIHYYSSRRDGPFIPVNCGAIPPELLESELFGHEKGAFTGAYNARKGRFELAQGGTLFLDEIGDMPHPMQVKLLRVLQERTFERVGGSKTLTCNVRIVAATHQHLEAQIKEGKFREDLFYRLNVFPIDVPSLRERQSDIPLLLEELVSRMESSYQTSIRFTQRCIESLMMADWSGNVRELSNLVERLVILYPNQLIDVNDLPVKYRHLEVAEFEPDYPEELQEQDAFAAIFSGEETIELPTKTLMTELPTQGVNLKEMLSELEVDLITQALEQQEHVVSRAADMLGMRRTTLVEKMRKYGLSKDG